MKDDSAVMTENSILDISSPDSSVSIFNFLPREIIYLIMSYQTPGELLEWASQAKKKQDHALFKVVSNSAYWSDQYLKYTSANGQNTLTWFDAYRDMDKNYRSWFTVQEKNLVWTSLYTLGIWRNSSILFSLARDLSEKDTGKMVKALQNFWNEAVRLGHYFHKEKEASDTMIQIMTNLPDKFSRNIFTCARLHNNQFFLDVVYCFLEKQLSIAAMGKINTPVLGPNSVKTVSISYEERIALVMLMCRQYDGLKKMLSEKQLDGNARMSVLTMLMQRIIRENFREEATFLINLVGKESLFAIEFPFSGGGLCRFLVEIADASESLELLKLFVGLEEGPIALVPQENNPNRLDHLPWEHQTDNHITYVSQQELNYLIQGGMGPALKDALLIRGCYPQRKRALYNEMTGILFKLIRLFSLDQLSQCDLDPATLIKTAVIVATSSSCLRMRQEAMMDVKNLFRSHCGLLFKTPDGDNFSSQTLLDNIIKEFESAVFDLSEKELKDDIKQSDDQPTIGDMLSEYSFGSNGTKEYNQLSDIVGTLVENEHIKNLRMQVEDIIGIYFEEERYIWNSMGNGIKASVLKLLEIYLTILSGDAQISLADKLFARVLFFYSKEDTLSDNETNRRSFVKIIVEQNNLNFLKNAVVQVVDTVYMNEKKIHHALLMELVDQVISLADPIKISCLLEVILNRCNQNQLQHSSGMPKTMVTYLKRLFTAYKQSLANVSPEDREVIQKNLVTYHKAIQQFESSDNLNRFFVSSKTEGTSDNVNDNNTVTSHRLSSKQFSCI